MRQTLQKWLPFLKTQRPTVYHVHDGASWVLYWVGKYVTDHLQAMNVPAEMRMDVGGLRSQIIHYGSRYVYLANPSYPHPSNTLFLTWHHVHFEARGFEQQLETLLANQDKIKTMVVSNQTTYRDVERVGWPLAKTVVIPIGVDTTLFQPPTPEQRAAMRQRLNIPEVAFCIGSFQKDGKGWEDSGGPKLIKGPDVFVETVAQVARTQPNVFVLLTGPARGYVKQGLDKAGVPYRHVMVDDFKDIAQYYHALDLYLITARAEGGPKGLMESWASGVPVISTAMGMPLDYIQHGVNGLLAEIEDTAALAEHVTRLMQDATLRDQMIARGLHDVQQLDWLPVSQQYYDRLYRPLLA